MSGISKGPTPWWQLPEYKGKRQNLEEQAPPGYEYDSVKMAYQRTPTAQGNAQFQYNNAANPALAGLMSSLGGGGGGGNMGGGFGGGGSVGGGAGGGGGSPFTPPARVGPASGNSAQVPQLAMPDQNAGINAGFDTAKDRVGKIGRASVDALRGELGATGNLGGGAEAQGVRDVVQSGAGELGQVSRDQAMKYADLSADFAKTNYAGSISQRGTDISSRDTQRGQDVTQRGQDVSAQEAQARLAQEQRIADQNRQLHMLQLAMSGLQGGGGGSKGGGLVY